MAEVRLGKHLTHLEDLVLLGEDGLDELNDKIESLIEYIAKGNSDKLYSAIKVDGSPAVFIWSKYPGYPDNSIALKSFLSGPQTAMSTPEQIDEKYGDRPTMSQMLKYALELAPHIPAGECWQGDCLFTKDSKKEENINGIDYITFRPNTIVYAFSEDNPGYKEVKNADFGIYFHTIYTGENYNQSFKIDLSRIDCPSNIYLMSSAVGNIPADNKFNTAEIEKEFNVLKLLEDKLYSNAEYDDLIANKLFMKYWEQYENNALADRQLAIIDENNFYTELKEFANSKIDTALNKKLGTLKTDASKEKNISAAEQEKQELADIVDNNGKLIHILVQTLNRAIKIKTLLWQGFRELARGRYTNFYKSKTKGYVQGDPEGIAVNDADGNVVKLVDRAAFSAMNRNPDIEKGWEHNESLEKEFTEVFGPAKPLRTSKLFEQFNRLIEAINDDYIVVSYSKMNPPTIGHLENVQEMAKASSSIKPRLYLSHSYGMKKKNDPEHAQPLTYERKIYWCDKAFGQYVDVTESSAVTHIQMLTELYNEGFRKVILVGGEDRIGGVDDMTKYAFQYNGQPDKSGNILYDFDDLKILSSGSRVEGVSSTDVRKAVLRNDYETFKKLVPFNDSDAEELWNEVRNFYKDNGIINEELNEADEKVFDSDIKNINKSKWNSAKSIRDIYDLLISEIGRDIDSDTRNLLDNTIKDIENLTNSLNISTITALSKKLNASSAGLSANEFIKLFKPSQDDLDALLKDGGREFGNLNLGTLGFGKASNFLNELIKYKGGSKDSTTNTGPYEFALALIFKNGTMKTGGAGDIKVDNYQVEVKSVSSDAVIGNESETNDMIRAFDDFVFINFDKEQKNKTRSARNSKSFNTVIQGEDIQKIPNIIRQNLNIRDTDTITYEKLFNDVFRYVINIYSKRFNYLAICKGYDVEMIPSNRVADELLGNSKYYITLADYVSGRFFKIRKRK